MVDTLGLVLVVLVTVASADDGTTAPQVLAKLTTETLSRLEVIWGDGKYRNNHLDRLHPPHRPDPDPSETDFRVPISHPSTSGGRVAIQCSQ